LPFPSQHICTAKPVDDTAFHSHRLRRQSRMPPPAIP
jgi:hypothetical protein